MLSVSFFVTLLCAAGELNLREARVVLPANASPQQKRAAEVLTEETFKRSQISWQTQTALAQGAPNIVIARNDQLSALLGGAASGLVAAPAGADGFRVQVSGQNVVIAGNDDRGVLYGVGYLLRKMDLRWGRTATVDNTMRVATAPKVKLRGHQLGFRPKVNSYDGFTVAMWDQYIRDLAVFGINAIELIPPRSDDAPSSPHFPLPQIEMMAEMSRIADSYGLDVWIWFPALDKDYADPATVEFALKEWSEVFDRLPRIDNIFVPGGDPGHTQPNYLMALLEKQTASLHKKHPKAGMWVAPQGFSVEWMEEFYGIVKAEPKWLTGVVFGPQVRDNIPKLRARIPARYPIRRYPDITHMRQSQYPVPDWDLAYQITEAREVINPRPTDEAAIFRAYNQYSIGFLTYSEGVNDDVNKAVWSGLGWDPDAAVIDILRDFGRFYIGSQYADSWAQGLLALEKNWRGPLLTNTGVATTLATFRQMEREASPQTKLNWRFQQGLYRAYYDEFVRQRLVYETALEQRAWELLRQAPRMGTEAAMKEAEETLDLAVSKPAAEDLRGRLYELAEALYQSIRAQLSVAKYQAIDVGRGANLDTTDMPLNNRWWLKQEFRRIRGLASEEERQAAVTALVERTNPGPGGYYDDFGNLTQQSHLVGGKPYAEDPAFLESSYLMFGTMGYGKHNQWTGYDVNYPISWWRNAAVLHDHPMLVRYEDLDAKAAYRVRIVYAGGSSRAKIKMEADGQYPIHDWLYRPEPFAPLEFDIPQAATADGKLELKLLREPGLRGNGRGLEVAEIWLLKK